MAIAWPQSVAEFIEFVHLDVIQLQLLPRESPSPSLLYVMTGSRLSEIESKLKSWIKVLFYFVKF